MKEMYFSPENIAGKSEQILSKYSGLRKRHKNDFLPENAALLIVDMQRYFVDSDSHANIPSAPAIVPKIKNLADAFIKMDRPVICTCHMNSSGNANLMEKWWKNLLLADDAKSNLIPELDIPSAIILKKTQYDAFYETDLNDILTMQKISQVVITGVMTHLCCETTARSAFMRGFSVFFPIDATATYNEEFHEASILNLSHGFAVPVLTKELMMAMDTI
ncbi:isochorismatase family protein [Methanogenium sp. MK-MG]|uniref:isochorismatase family protein n=1 Tax=Methanogenium sp. MK-MG TaxID=2599926 RepID=UPI0013EB5ACB|nr:isochorismatase family cysteine hydrolase [Methanogenium sp. MK-MG]KAF1077968.1 putative isochorismatase family protein [Methanogenium sp. MK-MG]